MGWDADGDDVGLEAGAVTVRGRVLVATILVVLIPLTVFALGIRREMTRRVTEEYGRRVAALAAVIETDLAQRRDAIGQRLAALAEAIGRDNRFRLGAVQDVAVERPYVLDYAGEAMRLAGLSLLVIQDGTGRILSSGPFRNDYDRSAPRLPRALARAPGGAALLRARTARGTMLAFARVDSLTLGGRRLTLVGGVTVDERFVASLARSPDLVVSLMTPGDTLRSRPLEAAADSARTAAAGVVGVPYLTDEGERYPARFVVAHEVAALEAVRRGIDRWFLAAAGGTLVIAAALAWWASSRVTRPLRELARKTETLDLDRLDVQFETARDDEVGVLSRLLAAMTERIRTSVARLRDVERQATRGELARQVNHDIRNGLAPIRNVLRHLAEVARDDPTRLPAVFEERRATLQSGIAYLESLAASYARLTPAGGTVSRCDVNDVVRQVAADVARPEQVELTLELARDLPPVSGDAVAVRRIVENLVVNAIESLDGAAGWVTVSTARLGADSGDGGGGARIVVADTGRGMTREQLDRAFEGAYSTKKRGTGLGLAIVRRLVLDAEGRLRAETEPGAGSRFVVDLPAGDSLEHDGTVDPSGRHRTGGLDAT